MVSLKGKAGDFTVLQCVLHIFDTSDWFTLNFLAKLNCMRCCYSSLAIFTLSKARLQVNIS